MDSPQVAPAEKGLPRALLLALFAALTLIWFADIEWRDLTHTDEGRYAEIPREMVATGDWLTPRLNGFKYFEKPPLHYWITAAFYELFGLHDWVSRLWTELASWLLILFSGWVAWRLYGPRAGWITGLVLAANPYFYLVSHINVLDTGLALFMNLCLFAFILAQKAGDEAGHRRWMAIAWGAAAGALLTKGLVGIVLPGAVFVLYSLLRRDLHIWTRLWFWPGLALFLALSAPWFVLVSLHNPDFARFFFIHEHFERFLTKTHGRYEPWWWFLPFLLLALLPWFGALRGVGRMLLEALRRPAPGFDERLFLILWTGFIFVFFSVSSSKLPHYLQPIMPALALLLGSWLAGRWPALAATALWTLLFGIVGLIVLSLDLPAYQPFLPWLPWLRVAFAVLAASGLLVYWQRKRGDRALLIHGLGWLLWPAIILAGSQSVADMRSARSLVEPLHEAIDGAPFYSVDFYQQTVPWYLRRTVTLVGWRGELDFGIQRQPEDWLPDHQAFARHWRQEPDAWALIPRSSYPALQAMHLPMQVRSENRDFLVVSHPEDSSP
ncbi:MAG: glycosyltransferase family 39 protein [Gammaproteobacteria bacterium]|nr:MAG: glycosyltransferase family 39 protein [Gammaproteobacteria bacterium]